MENHNLRSTVEKENSNKIQPEKDSSKSSDDVDVESGSLYINSSSSDDEDSSAGNQPTTVKKVKILKANYSNTPILWQNVHDNVILCGKRSLHCQNKGNLLFRDLISSAIVLHFKFENALDYNKEISIDEIYEKLKDHEWLKMDEGNCELSHAEIKVKIRKAFNDRKTKLKHSLDRAQANMSQKDADNFKKNFVTSLENKLSQALDYFLVFDYYPLDVKPNARIRSNVGIDDGMMNDGQISQVEFMATGDDMSVKSEITQDTSLWKRTVGKNKDITGEMNDYATQFIHCDDKSLRTDKSEDIIDEDMSRNECRKINANRHLHSETSSFKKIVIPGSRVLETETSIPLHRDTGESLKRCHISKHSNAVSGTNNDETPFPLSETTILRTKIGGKHIKSMIYTGGWNLIPLVERAKMCRDEVTSDNQRSSRRLRSETSKSDSGRTVQWTELDRNIPDDLEYEPESQMSEEMLSFRSNVLGFPVNNRAAPLLESDTRVKFDLNIDDIDAKELVEMERYMDAIIDIYREVFPSDVKVASVEETGNRYVDDKKSFSIIAPCRERTILTICHGSHRFHYRNYGTETTQAVHSCLISNIIIPENCMIILDENVVQAGAESMTSGFAPVFSPRYFAYLHHKDFDVRKNLTYNKFHVCHDSCKFCSDVRVLNYMKKLKSTISILESDGLSLAARNNCNDWIAGDLTILGWVVVRSGVPIDANLESKVGHELQTLLCTKNFNKMSQSSSWFVIDDKVEKIERAIPGTYRNYLHENDTHRVQSSMMWGERKMIPHLIGFNANNLEWFTNNGCQFIAKYFCRLERGLLEQNNGTEDDSEMKKPICYLDAIVGVEGANFDEYKCSGHCIIANFGFVRNQKLHMHYHPVVYDY